MVQRRKRINANGWLTADQPLDAINLTNNLGLTVAGVKGIADATDSMSCLFKELLCSATRAPCGTLPGGGVSILLPLPQAALPLSDRILVEAQVS